MSKLRLWMGGLLALTALIYALVVAWWVRPRYVIGNKVRFGGIVLPDADPARFQALAFPWGRDAERVYFRNLPVPGADPAHFEPLDERWARDQRAVFLGTPQSISGPIPRWRVVAAASVVRVPEADPASFRIWPGHPTWARDAHSVFRGAIRLPGADPERFQIRADGLQACAQRLYRDGVPIRSRRAGVDFDADPRSWKRMSSEHVSDGHGVWYWRDACQPRESPIALHDAEPDSFVSMGGGYGKDRERAWCRGRELTGVLAASLEVIGPDWARDEAQVWSGAHRLAEIDPRSFRGELAPGAIADAHQVYARVGPRLVAIPGADPLSYAPHPADPRYQRDRHRLYFRHIPIGPGPTAQIREGYAWDEHAVWYQAKALDGADPRQFRVLGRGVAVDGRSRWVYGRVGGVR